MGSRRVSFVVFASPKSGTQWIQQLLRAHPQVMCAESRVFGEYHDPDHVSGVNITLESYLAILGGYHQPPENSRDYFRGLLFNLLDTIAATSLEASGRSIYGEKVTPLLGTASTVVERLGEYDPELCFVHLSRDGRDVIVSGLVHQAIIHGRAGTALGRALQEAIAEQRVPDDMLKFFTDLWTQATSAALAAADVFGRFLHVRYEDLLQDTPGHAQRLLSFIGAETSDDIVDACVEAASFERMSDGRRRGNEDRSSVVRKGVAGGWVHWLTDEQAAWFDERAGFLMQRLGYDRVGVTTP